MMVNSFSLTALVISAIQLLDYSIVSWRYFIHLLGGSFFYRPEVYFYLQIADLSFEIKVQDDGLSS